MKKNLTCTTYHYSAKHSLISKCFLFFVSVLFFIACSSNKKVVWEYFGERPEPSAKVFMPKFDKQGHRGCRGLMPENTIPAMLHALSLGVTTLEMDVVFTKDSVAILSHEPFFNHEITTKPGGAFIDEKDEKDYNIFKMAFAETQLYDVGMKPHPRFPQQQKIAVTKPSLAGMFDSVRDYMMTRRRPLPFFNIETKTQPATDNIYHPAPEAFVDMLMKVIDEKQVRDFVTIQSFDIRTLQYLHKKYPGVSTALLIEDYDKKSLTEQLKTLGFVPAIYSPNYFLITDELIKQCHQQKIKVIPWTVNDKKEIERLKTMGVDGIISDYPNLFNE
jgi:glycerophosphoryl diester phosphodiesterase